MDVVLSHSSSASRGGAPVLQVFYSDISGGGACNEGEMSFIESSF